MDELAASQPNRLATQSSPYLRQHAHNPVDWYPWGSEALERAQRERKPILLSIGYAACHWCHVMAHESFEDSATAAVMNQLFVNIKVDREQRPDLDKLYQLAHQMLTGRGGGWPLTMFLMHEDQRPFFGGTYFPREAGFGLPAFAELLHKVADYYHEHLEALRHSAAKIVAALDEINASAVSAAPLNAEPLRACRARLHSSFDRQYGGFGAAPKFPPVPALSRLLRDWYASDAQALHMVQLTLTGMAEGGLFDQLGGGFFRYSVDARWEIPHFEKMLYDNAQLLGLYAEAAAASAQPLFADTASSTAAWMLREFANGEGALYSSLDADSQGHEGSYYLWQRESVQQALEPQEWAVFAARFNLELPPNFEGQWHLRVTAQLPPEQVRAALTSAREKLRRLRDARVRPALDDKVLCSWNALAISALASASRYLGREDYATSASAALSFLKRVHWRGGRLLSVSMQGSAQFDGYLDDYAFLLEAILELQSVRFRLDELQWAIELAEVMLRHFEDAAAGGFFFTADDHERLISRPKSFADEAIPAGNAVAARSLLRLGYLLGENRYLRAAERTLRACWPALQQYPQAHASMLQGLEVILEPPQIVLLRGRADAIEPWRRQLNGVFAPRRWTIAIAADVAGLPEALASKAPGTDALAYVCRGNTCAAPIDSLPVLLQTLGGGGA